MVSSNVGYIKGLDTTTATWVISKTVHHPNILKQTDLLTPSIIHTSIVHSMANTALIASETMSTQPRLLFIYGTLCAKPLLAWVLTGDASNVGAVTHLARLARVSGFARFAVKGCDYPAVIKHPLQQLMVTSSNSTRLPNVKSWMILRASFTR